MKINKNMIIAMTITFCFIASIFMAIPIRSQFSGQYDPWLDINDDGRISMDEIVASTAAFGTTGDPTKNVNVTNFPYTQPQPSSATQYLWFNSSINNNHGSDNASVYIGGYSRMFLTLGIIDWSGARQSVWVFIGLTNIRWGDYNDENVTGLLNCGALYAVPTYGGVPVEFTTKDSTCTLCFSIEAMPSSGWISYYVKAYLRNE